LSANPPCSRPFGSVNPTPMGVVALELAELVSFCTVILQHHHHHSTSTSSWGGDRLPITGRLINKRQDGRPFPTQLFNTGSEFLHTVRFTLRFRAPQGGGSVGAGGPPSATVLWDGAGPGPGGGGDVQQHGERVQPDGGLRGGAGVPTEGPRHPGQHPRREPPRRRDRAAPGPPREGENPGRLGFRNLKR